MRRSRFFGLAVTGIVDVARVKRTAPRRWVASCFSPSQLGIGILTTAEKKGLLLPEHQSLAAEVMCQLNKAGAEFAKLDGVSAMTDVTWFWLAGTSE